MKYLKLIKKGETTPTELESGVLYYDENTEKVSCKVEPKVPEGYVDLGLPSGLLWAKCNVGATSETEYGKFFQWGDTVGYEDASHSTWTTAPFNNGSSDYDSSYFTANSGTWLTETAELKNEYDAAYVATSGVAHMPTKADFEELIANTNVEWVINFNGANGRKFTSKKDSTKYIFIPASGYASNGSVSRRGSYGRVWSSSLNADSPSSAWVLGFDSSDVGVYGSYRCSGYSVRGVVSK